MNKKFIAGVLSGFAGALLLAIIGVSLFHIRVEAPEGILGSNQNNGQTTEGNGQSDSGAQGEITGKVNLLEEYIDAYFMGDINKEAYADGIYKGVVQSLDDRYSVYYTKEEYETMQVSSNGAYCGIGATVMQDVNTGVITIVEPFPDSPATDEGLLPGDIIYKVEGEEVTGEDLTQVVSRMKGKEGTKVTIEVLREGESDPITVTLTRRDVEKPTITSETLNSGIGYIKISEFDEVTSKQFRKALNGLEKKGIEGLVIDLRNNGGGRLEAVVDMLDRMLPEGLIVTVKDKNGIDREYRSSAKESFQKPLAILINGNSASASEVFAGAIQDYKLGTMVGENSFGKGIVQSVFPLKDGSAIKLTTAYYYTPEGRNIHKIGIKPEIEIELDKALKKKAVIEKSEDNQLQKAIEVVKQKIK